MAGRSASAVGVLLAAWLTAAMPAPAQDPPDDADLSLLRDMLAEAEGLASPLPAAPGCPADARRPVESADQNELVALSLAYYCLVPQIAGASAAEGHRLLVVAGRMRNLSEEQAMAMLPASRILQLHFDGKALPARDDLEEALAPGFAAAPLPPYGARDFLVAFEAPDREPERLQALHPAQAGILVLPILGEPLSLDRPIAEPVAFGPLTVALLTADLPEQGGSTEINLVVRNGLAQAFAVNLEDFAQLVDADGYAYDPLGAGEGGAQAQYLPAVDMLATLRFDLPAEPAPLRLVLFDEGGPVDLPLAPEAGESALPAPLALSDENGRVTLALLGAETGDGEVLLDLTARLNHDDPTAVLGLDLSQVLELHDAEGGFARALADAPGVARPFGAIQLHTGQPVRGTAVFPLPRGAGPYRLLLPFAQDPVALDIPAGLLPGPGASAEPDGGEETMAAATETEAAALDTPAAGTQARSEAGPFALALLGAERAPAGNGGDLLRLSLRLENTTADTAYTLVPADYLRLREDGAYLHAPVAEASAPSAFLGDVALPPGGGADGIVTFAVPARSAALELVLLTEAGPLVLPVEGAPAEAPEPAVATAQAEVGGGVAVSLSVFAEPSADIYESLPAPPEGRTYLLVDLALGMTGGDALTTLPLDPFASIRLDGAGTSLEPVRLEALPRELKPFELWSGLSHRGLLAFLLPRESASETWSVSVAGILDAEVPQRERPVAVTPEKSVITLGVPPEGEPAEAATEAIATTPETTVVTLPPPPADVPEDLELAKRIGAFGEDGDVTWNLVRDRFGYRATGLDHPEYLGDGDFYSHALYTTSRVGESFVISLIEPTLVSAFSFKLWDGDDRFFRYRVEYSEDGVDWVLLADRSEGEHRGWQDFELDAVAGHFRITGLYSSLNEYFHVMEAGAFAARPLDLRREVASRQRGGRVVAISPASEGGDRLIDGHVEGEPWRAATGAPVELTLGFTGEALLPVHALLLYPASPEEAPQRVELLATTGGADGPFTSLGVFELESTEGPQLLSFEPLWARHVKLRLLESFGGEAFALQEIRVFEANQNARASVSDRLMAHAAEGEGLPYQRDLTYFENGGQVERLPEGQQDLLALIDRDPATGYAFAANPDAGAFVVSFFAGRTTLVEAIAFQLEANQAQGPEPGRLSLAVATESPDGPFTEVADVLVANTGAPQIVRLPEPVAARYLKAAFRSPIEGGQITLLGLAAYEADDLGGAPSALRIATEPPDGIGPNIARDAFGGRVVSVTSSYEEWMPHNGLQGLVDENVLAPTGWRAGDAPDRPQDIVIGFRDDREAKIAAVSLMPSNWRDPPAETTFGPATPHRFEIWVSNSPDGGWRQIGGVFHLRNSPARQFFELSEPVLARYVKVRILDNYHGEWIFLGDIGVHEAAETGGYRSILDDMPVNLADPRLGGSLIRHTSRYDAAWGVYNLVDGSVETNGWSSSDGALPQRFLFAFDRFRTARIAAVVIDQRIASQDLYAPSQVKIAATTENDPTAEMTTIGVFEIGAEGRQEIVFDAPFDARFVEVSFLARHGTGAYTAVGEIEIHEAEEAGYVSILDRPDDGEETTAAETGELARLTADAEEAEPNNERNTATALELGRAMLGRIDPAGDVDVFALDLGDDGSALLNLRLDGTPFIKQYLTLRNGAGGTVFTFDPREAGQSQSFTLPAPPDSYALEVSEPTTSVVLVFDSSGSMEGRVEALKQAADRYIADKQPHEEMAIVRFNHNVDVLSDFTTDADALRAAVEGQLFADGGTALYLALFRAIELLETREGNRAIVLLSDGEDSGDGAYFPELWQALDDAGIRLFSVGLGGGLTNYSPTIAAKPDMVLQAWSAATGGEFFFAPDAGELLEIYSSVSEQLRGQSSYRLTATVPAGEGAISVAETGERITGVSGPSRLVMIFDASNSMNGAIAGLGPKIDVAKEVMRDIVESLPEGLQVGLRVYGHRVSRHEKARSCNDTELVVPFGPLDRSGLISAVDAITPQGQTPIGRSLRRLAADFGDSEGPKLVLLISDGIESCDEDPASADYPPRVVQELNDAGLEIVVNIVGFDITENSTRRFLQGIAEMTGGRLYTADNSDQLRNAIEQAMRAGFHVLDSVGNTVAQGSVGAGPIAVPEGVYRVAIDADPLIELRDVEVVRDKETRLLVNKEGEELATERELLDEISEAPIPVMALPPAEPIVLEDTDIVDGPADPPPADDGAREMVREIQGLLADKGYEPGPADGLIGPQTRDAIRHFQSDAGMVEDGEVGAALLDALRLYEGRASVRTPAPATSTSGASASSGSQTKPDVRIVVGVLTDILDTANLIVDGQIVRLAGVYQDNDATVINAMQTHLVGLDLICAESGVAGLGGFFCLDIFGLDLGEEMLRRGVARADVNAPHNYLAAEDEARRNGVGLWR